MYSATVVFVPLTAPDVETEVARLLAPFSHEWAENSCEVPCYCVGSQARREAEKIAHAVASHKELNEKFRDQHLETLWRHHFLLCLYRPFTAEEKQESEKLEDELGQLWEEATAAHRCAYRQALDIHPFRHVPDPDCTMCEGTGLVTTINPQGKWQRWRIGGRWSGFFDTNYNPRRDPANLTTCETCGGTGNREGSIFYILDGSQMAAAKMDEAGNEIPGTRIPNWPLPPGTKRSPWCNACATTGLAHKPTEEWADHEATVVAVCSLGHDARLPEAVVTPDGKWHQYPEDNNMSHSEKKAAKAAWTATYHQLLAQHFDCLGVACELE